MCKLIFCLLNIIAVICLTTSNCVIPEFTRCKLDEFECYVSLTRQVAPLFLNGCPELGIERFAPLFLPGLDASTPHLKFMLGDTIISGMDTCKSISIGRNDDGKMYNKFVCDLKYEGMVDIKGHLLTFHTEGQGTMKLVFNQVLITAIANVLKHPSADGKNHLKLTDYDIHYEMLGEPQISFDDHFGGDGKFLHANLGGFLKLQPPRKVVALLSKPLLKGLVTKLANNINIFFAYMPADDLVLK